MFDFRYPFEKYTEPAGFGRRLLAFFLDAVAFFILMIPISMLSWALKLELSDSIPYLLFTLYFVFFTWRFGRTFGKFHTELKVESIQGERISLMQSIARMIFNWGFLLLPSIALFLSINSFQPENTVILEPKEIISFTSLSITFGVIMGLLFLLIIDFGFILFRKDKRALHDLIAGTRCMKK